MQKPPFSTPHFSGGVDERYLESFANAADLITNSAEIGEYQKEREEKCGDVEEKYDTQEDE